MRTYVYSQSHSNPNTDIDSIYQSAGFRYDLKVKSNTTQKENVRLTEHYC